MATAMVTVQATMDTAMATVLETAGLLATVKKLAFFDKVAVLYTAQALAMEVASNTEWATATVVLLAMVLLVDITASLVTAAAKAKATLAAMVLLT